MAKIQLLYEKQKETLLKSGFLYTDESICLFRTDFVPGYSIIQDEQEAR